VRRAGIPGQPPNPADLVAGCPFAERCVQVRPECHELLVTLESVGEGHQSACPYVRDGVSVVVAERGSR
jgi:oligopeptide/dipeptide ABC transporter ATP-binding protein